MSTAAEFPWTSQDAKADLCFLFANAPIGLAECQGQGNIIAMNPALERMLEGRPKVARLPHLSDLIFPEENSEGERLLGELFEGVRDSIQIEPKAGVEDVQPLRWTAWRVPGANGGPDSLLAVAEDARANQEAEQRLRQAESLEAVGRLAGGVAHDFNNLLTGVMLYCDLLMVSLEPGHKGRKYAEEIRSASLQATGLVRQLLAVARPRSCQPCLLSFNEIAQGMGNLLIRLIGENIELKSRLDPNLGLIKMDPAQAQQILLNLVLNARDAMPGGGQITIETSNCRVQVLAESHFVKATAGSIACALLVVGDNGCGMDAETRAHLFEAFFTTKPAGHGTGLGLATVYDIVTSNGGLVHVDSAPGCGTRFTVLLPLAPERARNSQNVSELQAKGNVGVSPTEEED
ncbi:MAG: two-component system sensor histidine kinase NtrB [Candidatus Sulfotelmatobacter sp.]